MDNLTFIKNIDDYNSYKQLKPVNLYKYKKVQFICTKCGKTKTKVFKALTPELICKNCTISAAVAKPDVIEKKKQTCIQKYGVDHYNKTEQSKEQHKLTNIQRYGVEHYAQSDKSKKHYKELCNKKYGVDNVFQLDSVKNKSKNTSIDKYGIEYYTKTDESKLRYKLTCQEKYGVDNVSQIKSITEKKKQTCLEHYGVEFPILNDDIRKMIKSKYTFNDYNFDSIPELAYFIWLTDNNIEFTYHPNIKFEYKYNNKIHFYYPDFLVNGCYIEIKGLQFFQDKDVTKPFINPYNKSINELYAAKYNCLIKNNIKIFTETEYNKYIDYVNNKYSVNFMKLFKNALAFPYLNQDLHDISDYGIIQHFHKSIYNANRFGKPSPLNAWQNKNLIKIVALNRLKYKGRCTPNDILQGFNVTKIAPKVSVFKPSLATLLINQYLSDAETIIDPFSGFSGRMLGTYNCNKQYIGYDINEIHVKESNEIISYKSISNKCSVNISDILHVQSTDWSQLKNTCLFTCPPYSLKEQWNIVETDKTCDEWIDICIEKYTGCKKYLFVVDNTVKYKNNIVFTLTNSSHFGSNNEYVILLNN